MIYIIKYRKAGYDLENVEKIGRRQGPSMSKQVEKRDFPVSQVRRYLEPGPIVLG